MRISLTMFSVISFGAAAPGTKTAPTIKSRRRHMFFDGVDGRIDGAEFGSKSKIKIVEAGQRNIDQRHMRFHPHRYARGVGAYDPAAENGHLGRRHAGNAAKQLPAAARFHLKTMRARLDRHASGYFAHRCEQRQAAARIGYRLVGDAGDACG